MNEKRGKRIERGANIIIRLKERNERDTQETSNHAIRLGNVK